MSRLRLIGLFALAKLLLHLATSTGYGYFRDEFYYLACTEHLAPGYVDHPSLSILFLWAVRHLLGDSRPALRLLPAVLGAATVALAGLMARALGGGRWAVALAMTGALIAPEYLALNHFYSMNAFDIFFWALAVFLLIRLIDGADPRLWLLLGLVLGLGLANKISVLWPGAGLLAGLVATPQRRWLATRWPWLCGAIAVVLFSPYLFWQVRHGWPTLEFIHNATTDKMVAVAPLDFLIGQIRMVHPLTLPLWMGGLAWLRPVAVVLLIVAGAVTAPLALPLLPVDTYIRCSRALGERPSTEERKELGELGQFYADMQGWDAIVGTIADVYRRLPAQDATAARIFAPDYGVAGALDLLGRRQGLPPAISAHNNYWLWGPRGWDGRVLIVVGGEEDRLDARFEAVERAATIDCGRCMPCENGRPVWVCRGLRAPIAETWAQIKHYD